MMAPLRPAGVAFDAIAPTFDLRFGHWLSVAAQRRAVRTALLREFPTVGHILELGGGTGEDAMFLAEHGFDMFLTDPSPAMVSMARAKLAPFGAEAGVAAGEELEDFASGHLSAGGALFDEAFSNFAPLNCIVDTAGGARTCSIAQAWGRGNAGAFRHSLPRRDGDGSASGATSSGAAAP